MAQRDLVQELEDWANNLRPRLPQRSTIPSPVDAEDIVDVKEHEDRDLIKLLIRMRDGTVTSQRSDWILEECKWLFRRDYECKILDNFDNNLPGVHPKVLVIPVAELKCTEEEKRMHFDAVEYLLQEDESTYINVTRFPCPVILFNGKYVCRSRYPSILKDRRAEQTAGTSNSGELPRPLCSALKFARMRGEIKKNDFGNRDATFLQSLGVSHIIDFTNSTECDFKGDIMNSANLKNIYQHIEISSMPFPGPGQFSSALTTMEITKKYLLEILQKLVGGRSGVLLQSFKGCNRNALFTSLLRISLWADGVIHKSLDMREIIFLTIGYDWYFFGHQINDGQNVFKEMITFFYTFMSVMSGDEFSIARIFQDQSRVNQASSVPPISPPSRREQLRELSIILWKCFDKAHLYYTSFNKKETKES